MAATWTTGDELALIDSIGSRANISRRLLLLNGYLESAKRRTNWAGLDRQACIDYANKLLAQSNELEVTNASQ